MKKKILLILVLGFAFGMIVSAQKHKVSQEQEMINRYFDLQYKQGDSAGAEKVRAKILKKFPRGKFARRQEAEGLARLQGEEFFAAADKFRKDFPVADFYKAPDDQGFVYVNFYNGYIRALWSQKKYDKLKEVLPECEFSMVSDLYQHSVMWLVQKAPTDPKEYAEMSKVMLDEMIRKAPVWVDMYQTGQKPYRSQEQQLWYYLAVETEILAKSGQYQEALSYMDRIPADERFNQYAQGNQAYYESLKALGRNDNAAKALEGSASTGLLTSDLFKALRGHYDELSSKPKPTFDEYFASLKSDKARENLTREVMQGMMEEDYPAFEMESIRGGKVKSADFKKDEIVVLDFWATWCAPCIAAMEGMQMAVNKYQADPRVKFYFVCTQDARDDARVGRVFQRKRLDSQKMEVLYDHAAPGKEEPDAVYRSIIKGTSGIPQKAVLKNGKVRYIAEGYGGSPSGLMDEISAVIELLKAE